ncbi:MAG: hypothetical protein AB7S80_08695 [Rhizobiaceae bacterium]
MIETAIRNALEKGNADDAGFREKVYRSARAALDRALKANPGTTVETAINRRKGLEAKIAEIESEFLPALMPEEPAPSPRAPAPPSPAAARPAPAAPPVAVRDDEPDFDVAPAVEVASPAAPRPTPVPVAPVRVEPVVAAPPLARREPDFAAPDFAATETQRAAASHAPDFDVAAERDPASVPGGRFDIPAQSERVVADRRRGPWATLIIIFVLLAILAGGGWWAWKEGWLVLPGGQDTTTPAPPVTGGENYDPDEEPIGAPALPGEADSRDWVSVFTPSDAARVSAPADTKAEVMQDDSGSYMRIRSSASGSAIIFDVGQGVLERLAGKRAAFDIVARATEEGGETQISVTCNLGELGGCGRKRYAVGITKSDYLFEIDLPAKSPGAGGTIAINTDIDGGGKAIDIYEIRVAVSE